MTDTTLARTLLDLAERTARSAGEELLSRVGSSVEVESKSTRTDLVSAADRAADAIILDALRAARPNDAFLTEESGGVDHSDGIRWVIDPLDGTINFLWTIPSWAVSIAATDALGPLVGVVFDPSRDEMFTGIRGEGAWLNGAPISLNPTPPMEEALVATGFSYDPDERVRQAEIVTRLIPRVRDIRRFGAAALDLVWLACGRFDAYYERGVHEWDWAAGGLIAQEAGADIAMLEPVGDSPFGVLAASSPLVAPLLEVVEAGG